MGSMWGVVRKSEEDAPVFSVFSVSGLKRQSFDSWTKVLWGNDYQIHSIGNFKNYNIALVSKGITDNIGNSPALLFPVRDSKGVHDFVSNGSCAFLLLKNDKGVMKRATYTKEFTSWLLNTIKMVHTPEGRVFYMMRPALGGNYVLDDLQKLDNKNYNPVE